ncbi:hypothetical protein PENSTE_c005G01103 [Penicillium steckii]|uniref:Uncharacterized protein n=1 Tax=Penicillium steckii TaxID=303698 RepID=A0A1V6TIW4_9EURO|nr:hypothetical protein PENSTE_c005G01103 [Penicillium steckii]
MARYPSGIRCQSSNTRRKWKDRDPFSSVPQDIRNQAAANTIVKLRKLTAHGASLDAQDSKGLTPVIYATTLENMEILKVLVSEGANINARCHLGRTPLIYASVLRSLEMARCIMEQGGSVTARCHKGRTPLIYTSAKTNITTKAISPMTEDAEGDKIAKSLIEKGAEIDPRCSSGCTPLHYASDAKRHELATTLLDQGAYVNAEDNTGRTPLHCAAKRPDNDLLVKKLIRSGAKINQRLNGTVTALEIATKLDAINGSVIRYLVKHGAECEMEDPIVKRRVIRAQRWLKLTMQL